MKLKRQSKNVTVAKPLSQAQHENVLAAEKTKRYSGYVPREIIEQAGRVRSQKQADALQAKADKNQKLRKRAQTARNKMKVPPADMAKVDKAMKKAAKADRESLAKRGIGRGDDRFTRMLKTHRTKQ